MATEQDTLAAYRATAKEKDIQEGIVRHLRALGYTVFEVGKAQRRKVRCPACGHMHWPTGWMGNDVATPDVWVFVPRIGGYIALEVKRPGGRFQPGQKELAAAGKSVIVHSQEEAVFAVLRAEVPT